jgi:hypothetical protein
MCTATSACIGSSCVVTGMHQLPLLSATLLSTLTYACLPGLPD